MEKKKYLIVTVIVFSNYEKDLKFDSNALSAMEKI